jgi:general secretion pathway protein D
LKVAPEVSRVFDVSSKTVSGQVSQADIYDFRKIETHVMIPSGNTLVLGGLVSDDIRNGSTKVPVLGDIPFLGRLFRSDSKNRIKDNLLIFITPTIVQDSDYQIDKTDFLKSSKVHNTEPDWNWWDSGKAADADWSKLNTHHEEFK